MLPAQFDSPRSVSILFSSCEIRAPSVRYPSSFLVDSYSGACGIAATAGERVGLHIAIPGPSGIRRTKNLRAVQLLLGHTKLESTVRYLGIEVDDALEMAEQTEV